MIVVSFKKKNGDTISNCF